MSGIILNCSARGVENEIVKDDRGIFTQLAAYSSGTDMSESGMALGTGHTAGTAH